MQSHDTRILHQCSHIVVVAVASQPSHSQTPFQYHPGKLKCLMHSFALLFLSSFGENREMLGAGVCAQLI